MSNDNVYLSGKIRDRIQDLMKSNKVPQTEGRVKNYAQKGL